MRIPTALVLLSFAACGAESPESSAGDSIRVDVSSFTVLGSDESIATVRDLEVLDDGAVWVLNSIEPLFVGFSADGGVLDAHGRLGGGPGEYRAVAGLMVGGRNGEAWVLDGGRHGLDVASRPATDETLVRFPPEIPPGSVLPGMSLMGSSIRTVRWGDEVIVPRRLGSGEVQAITAWTTMFDVELVAWHPESGSVNTVVSLPATLGDMTERFAGDARAFPPFPFWMRLWAVCGEELRLYDFTRDEVRGFTRTGVEVEPIPVPVPFTRVSPRQASLVLFDMAAIELAGAVTPAVGEMTSRDSARVIEGVVSRVSMSPTETAAILPKYVDFRCSDEGAMWLRPLDLDRGSLNGGPTWVQITRDGRAREVEFPEGFDPFRFVDGRVWGALRDEFDIASVAWVEAPVDN